MCKENVNISELAEKAYRTAYEYLPRWRACGPAAFAAIMDTLGYSDDDSVNDIWKAVVGLTGGTGNMATGTCGAFAGAAAAISYSFGHSRDVLENDVMKMLTINSAVAEVGNRMKEKYGHTVCQEVQFSLWGKAFRFTNPDAMMEFAALSSSSDDFECRKVVGDLAMWAVEKILERNPSFFRPQINI